MSPPLTVLQAPRESGGGGHLPDNLLAFGRVLRRAGIPVGPSESLAAAAALRAISLGERREFQAALRATMVHRQDHAELFDQAFALFWRDPEAAKHDASMVADEQNAAPAPAGSRRLAEAMQQPNTQGPQREAPEQQEITLSISAQERLQTLDFESMSAEEIAAAKHEITRLALPLEARPIRRFRSDPLGPVVDMPATIRASLRRGGELVEIAHKRRITRPPPLVVLCDISGSMARYAQILLHFIHAVAQDRERVHSFLFGTRLTNISRALRQRDPEVAFQMVTHLVQDWSGGTRIGESLENFNRLWARRVLGQGAVVLLITDGLDRDGAGGLAEATDRLRHSCHRLIWLNPLLRYAGFQPKSQGIRAMLPHVDEFRPVHNLASLRGLIQALSAPAPRSAALSRRSA